MKKAKRFLTGLLSAVLALSLCAMPAMAADNGETITSTINTAQKGSLTINTLWERPGWRSTLLAKRPVHPMYL